MSARQRRRNRRHANLKRWEPEPTPALDAMRLRWLDCEDADGDCPLCVETIQLNRFRWLCPSCRQDHVATVCFNCSHVLAFGTDHGEPHRVDLVAAADDYFAARIALDGGGSPAEIIANSVAADGPARHLHRLPCIDVTDAANRLRLAHVELQQ